jgi:hypothetical protein
MGASIRERRAEQASAPRQASPRSGRSLFGWALAALVLLGLALRLAILFSPLGELDGDEAVVGLMARHIAFEGERPVFYWGQPYLGSLEAFTAAPIFRVFDSSTLALKLVPTAYSLGFLVLSALLARRLFGVGPALATGAYLALPPAMWAVWSTKARGGYAELLFLGEALLLITLWWAARPARSDGRAALLWGLLAGLSVWTHLLAVVYVLPSGVYLVLQRRPRLREMALAGLGVLVGMLPVLIDNVAGGFQTLQALLQPPDLPLDPLAQFERFFRVGLPVLAGLAQPTTSAAMFDADWLTRPAGHLPVAVVFLLLLGLALAAHRRALRELIRVRPHPSGASGPGSSPEPALLLLLAACVPPVIALTRFGFFVSEPRYALPLYAVVPLVMGAVWRLPALARGGALAGLLALNVFSLASTDIRLWRPEDALDSTAATRAALVQYLVHQDRHQMYTDYWIGYPIMFETRETVLAYVVSGGFNRYLPPADNVQRTPNPAWVFERDSEAESDFTDDLRTAGGTARVTDVAVYRVYTDVQPIDVLRPPR